MFDARTEIDLEKMEPFGNTEGKNSQVFLAHDKQLANQFIVKRIKKEDIYNDYGSTDENNLFTESKILYKVSHPNITEIQYASFDEEYIYLVMPYYFNGSIQAVLDTRNLTMKEFIKYSLDFLGGLLFVHSNKFVHFDIKPTNILINNNGKAALTDFGLSKALNCVTELASPNKLYKCHWPPEYFLSHELSQQADIYQAGVTMYRMVNGNSVWESSVNKATEDDLKEGKFPDKKNYLPHIPKKIIKIINHCLEGNPDRRYDNVLDIINDLSSVEPTQDWFYAMESELEQSWILEKENMRTCIDLVKDGDTYNICTTKINLETGNSQKVSAMNCKKITLREAYQKVADFIHK